MNKLELLTKLDFGQSVAEQEIEHLHKYFVQTKQWNALLAGEVDVVYGPKGSGKSALYTLLDKHEAELFQRGVVLRFAENPRGATAFSDLQVSPPAKELEFVNLWKLYLLSLLGTHFVKFGAITKAGKEVVKALTDSGLITAEEGPIKAILSRTRYYITKYFNAESFEPNVSFNESTGTVEGVGLKIAFKEPTAEQSRLGIQSVEALMQKANDELAASGFSVWFLLDRLDVAFAESPELEANALRALFKVYLDFASLEKIKLKIFLRSDIWTRITRTGFREATHITRSTTIGWENQTLQNLIIRRFLNNAAFVKAYAVSPPEIVSSITEQEKLFYRVFPEKVDSGKNPLTLAWIGGRTSDGKNNFSPRDVINLINFCIVRQTRLLEIGQDAPPGENLFQRSVIKDALSDASKEKVEKHLFAEYPAYRGWFEAMRGGKSQYNQSTLAQLWNVTSDEAQKRAQELVEIGFWVKEGPSEQITYWVPFIYRDGLDIKQGQAEASESTPQLALE